MRMFAILFAAAALVVGGLQANAANTTTSAAPQRCRDAQGHFIRCPTSAATTTPQRCRNAQGRFIACPRTTTTPPPQRCRNAQGHFIACPATPAANAAH
jgi:hypothetical protein